MSKYISSSKICWTIKQNWLKWKISWQFDEVKSIDSLITKLVTKWATCILNLSVFANKLFMLLWRCTVTLMLSFRWSSCMASPGLLYLLRVHQCPCTRKQDPNYLQLNMVHLLWSSYTSCLNPVEWRKTIPRLTAAPL